MNGEVPRALLSEQSVLNACLWSPAAMTETARTLSADDWYSEQHRQLWHVMVGLQTAGIRVDPSAVMAEAVKVRPGLAEIVASLTSQTSGGGAGSLGYHLEKVERAAIGRELLQVAQRSVQEAESDREPVEVAEETIDALRRVQRMRTGTDTTIDVLDLITQKSTAEDWVVEGLLARMERLILTAPEGYGKTTMLRQFAGCVAGGLHPFRTMGIQPRRALVIDAENPEEINRVEYKNLIDQLDEVGHEPKPGMLMIEQCGPVNVLDARVAAGLMALAEKVKPDLILIGPLYQLHEENPNDEGPARKLSAFLDRLRMVNRAALITEAHTPHSDGPNGQMLRPYGASLWKRWPEFGYCLHPAETKRNESPEDRFVTTQIRASQLTAWRGNRAKKRQWPMRLHAGTKLPWEEVR